VRRIKVPMELAALTSHIRASWTRETSNAGVEWRPSRPSIGQCAVTALIVQDHLGGEIMRTTVRGESHYFNVVNGEVIDLTADQFPYSVIGAYANAAPRTREYILGNHHTKQRYDWLSSRVNMRAGL
jgi:hypothetical protein